MRLPALVMVLPPSLPLLSRPARSAAAGLAGGAAAVVDLAAGPGLAATGVDVLDVAVAPADATAGTSAGLPGVTTGTSGTSVVKSLT